MKRKCRLLSLGTFRETKKDSVTEKKYMGKPPLGLKPRSIHEKERITEILEAMKRYNDVGKSIPLEWANELCDLL